jgi:hypothetical protein
LLSFGRTCRVSGPPRTRTAFTPGKNRGFTVKVCDPSVGLPVPPVGLEPTQAGLKDRNPSRRAPAANWSRAPAFLLLSSCCHRASPRNRTLRAPEGEPFTAVPEPSSARRESPETHRNPRGKPQKRRKPPPGLPGAASAWFPAISSWSHRLPPQARVAFDRERLRIEARANGAAIHDAAIRQPAAQAGFGRGPVSPVRYRVCGSRLHDDFHFVREACNRQQKISTDRHIYFCCQPMLDVTPTCVRTARCSAWQPIIARLRNARSDDCGRWPTEVAFARRS